ncbi:MAG TPA: hypothetical protein VMM84_13955 [Pyrinomonadaceae bacterium]|nr:hypothetical protein [Pyrinomonadaceae bacterium]
MNDHVVELDERAGANAPVGKIIVVDDENDLKTVLVDALPPRAMM